MGKTRTEASRAERKAKKRAAEEAIPDVPDSWTADPQIEVNAPAENDSKKRKRDTDEGGNEGKEDKESKKERKKRRKEAEAGEAASGGVLVEKNEKKVKKEKRAKGEATETHADLDTDTVNNTVDGAPKKSKKERKAERKAKEAAEVSAQGAGGTELVKLQNTEVNGSTKKSTDKPEDGDEKKSKKNNRNREKKRKGANGTKVGGEVEGEDASSKAARFIVFVGQLPFTATKESVEKHFASIKPKSVRVPTEKGQSGKAKGYAFVEFEGYDHMKTCLKLFHHSLFNDGISAAREINVNLTAGGGGNTKERKGKIEEKNQKLDEQRVRRRQEEEKAKLTKKAEGTKKDLIDESAIHPSRRGRVPITN
ncbi:hypothetical protein VTL71DRAFT_3061 [Oculimacula yallundae]|uniref:RRM domain-containing protein n=1 Tax=Oculimacula yallundae TaxID=86028 RepID=A0ABR4C778_9HELO